MIHKFPTGMTTEAITINICKKLNKLTNKKIDLGTFSKNIKKLHGNVFSNNKGNQTTTN